MIEQKFTFPAHWELPIKYRLFEILLNGPMTTAGIHEYAPELLPGSIHTAATYHNDVFFRQVVDGKFVFGIRPRWLP